MISYFSSVRTSKKITVLLLKDLLALRLNLDVAFSCKYLNWQNQASKYNKQIYSIIWTTLGHRNICLVLAILTCYKTFCFFCQKVEYEATATFVLPLTIQVVLHLMAPISSSPKREAWLVMRPTWFSSLTRTALSITSAARKWSVPRVTLPYFVSGLTAFLWWQYLPRNTESTVREKYTVIFCLR